MLRGAAGPGAAAPVITEARRIRATGLSLETAIEPVVPPDVVIPAPAAFLLGALGIGTAVAGLRRNKSL